MEIGRGHFQGSVEAHSHGTTPTIREVADEGEAQFSSANAIEAGELEEGAPEGHSKEQSGVYPGCNLCPWSGSRSHSFVLIARGFAEGQGHVWKAREPSPGGREEPQREGRESESEGHTIGGSPPVVGCGQSRCRANQSRFGNGESSMSCSPCWGTSRFVLKIRRTCQRSRSETTDRGTSSAGVVGQVRVAGHPGVGRTGTPSSGSPSDPSRHCPTRGGGWEPHRRVGCSASRSGSIEEERDAWLGKSNSQSMDTSTPRILESRSSRMATLIDEADAKRRCVDVPSTIANYAS